MRLAAVVAIVFALALIMLDGFQTRAAVRAGKREKNPIRRFLIQRLGLDFGTVGVAAVVSVVLFLGWREWYGPRPDMAIWLALAVVFPYLFVALQRRKK